MGGAAGGNHRGDEGGGAERENSCAEHREVITLDTVKLVGDRTASRQSERHTNQQPKSKGDLATRSIMPMMLVRGAPRATRMPISLVRRATVYAATP